MHDLKVKNDPRKGLWMVESKNVEFSLSCESLQCRAWGYLPAWNYPPKGLKIDSLWVTLYL